MLTHINAVSDIAREGETKWTHKKQIYVYFVTANVQNQNKTNCDYRYFNLKIICTTVPAPHSQAQKRAVKHHQQWKWVQINCQRGHTRTHTCIKYTWMRTGGKKSFANTFTCSHTHLYINSLTPSHSFTLTLTLFSLIYLSLKFSIYASPIRRSYKVKIIASACLL